MFCRAGGQCTYAAVASRWSCLGWPCCKVATLLLLVLLLLHPFNGLFSRTAWISQWGLGMKWHQLDHMQTICTLLRTDNHTNTSSLSFYRPDALPAAQPTVSKHTHTHPFNGPLSGTTRVSRYQKGKTNLDFADARDSEWQWYQLGHMQVCTSLQTDNHASTSSLSFFQAVCSSWCSTNSVEALKAVSTTGFDFQHQVSC